MTFSVEERIDAPSAEVWRHLADPALMVEWMDGVESMRSGNGGALMEGGELLFRSRRKERSSTVVELRPERAMTLRSVQGPVTATYRYRMAPDDRGVRVTLDADCKARGVAFLFKPLISFMIRRVDGGQLKALKTIVEGPAQQ